jgi:dCMP deaminase
METRVGKIISPYVYGTTEFTINGWNIKMMELADHIATWSKDRSTRVGAVIVRGKDPIAMGVNGFPCGCDDEKEERHQRPLKYDWVLHAEENAIIKAAKYGHATDGADMYVNWFPCSKCAGMIVNAGIKRIFCDQEPDFSNVQFGAGFKLALEKLYEGGVEVIYMNYEAHRNANR